MDTGFLLNTVLNGVLGARTKRSHRARHYLTGGLLSNPAALVTAAGLAWGALESEAFNRNTRARARSGFWQFPR